MRHTNTTPFVSLNTTPLSLSSMAASEIKTKLEPSAESDYASLTTAILHGWGGLTQTFRSNDIVGIAGNIVKCVSYYTPAGFGFLLKTDNDNIFVVLSMRAASLVVISPIIAGVRATRHMRVMRQPRGQMSGLNMFKVGSSAIMSGIWSKLNPFTRLPSHLESVTSSDAAYSWSEVLVRTDPVLRSEAISEMMAFGEDSVSLPLIVDLPQTMFMDAGITHADDSLSLPLMLVESSVNGHQSITGYIPAMNAVLFVAIMSATRTLRYYSPLIIDKSKETTSTMKDNTSLYNEYIKRGDPELCKRLSGGRQSHPYSSLEACLDEFDWGMVNVDRTKAEQCIKTQSLLTGSVVNIYNTSKAFDSLDTGKLDMSVYTKEVAPETVVINPIVTKHHTSGSTLEWILPMYMYVKEDTQTTAALVYDMYGRLYTMISDGISSALTEISNDISSGFEVIVQNRDLTVAIAGVGLSLIGGPGEIPPLMFNTYWIVPLAVAAGFVEVDMLHKKSIGTVSSSAFSWYSTNIVASYEVGARVPQIVYEAASDGAVYVYKVVSNVVAKTTSVALVVLGVVGIAAAVYTTNTVRAAIPSIPPPSNYKRRRL
jgi:hypothetical protein